MNHEQRSPEQQPHGQPADVEQQPGAEQERRTPPSIWVGSLLDYNNGILHGDWIDATQPDEAITAAVQHILTTSPSAASGDVAEECGIFDYDEFGEWKPGEYEDLRVVAVVARGIRDHGPAFAAFADLHDADPDILASFEDAYLGEHDSIVAWAEAFLDESGAREQLERSTTASLGSLAEYVTFDAALFANAAWLSGDIHIIQRPGGGVWVFSANP